MKSSRTESRAYHHGDLRRTLINAALALIEEGQDWSFSLREVARRAEVSHTAPYNHFPEKRDLLAAVASVGFERLRDGMLQATAGIDKADAALRSASTAYVIFAKKNPALYRLMFGPTLAVGEATPQKIGESAGAKAKEVLEEIVLRGSRTKLFSPDPADSLALGIVTLSCWSSVHGLATLIIDERVDPDVPISQLVDGVMGLSLDGIRRRRQRTA